MNSTHLKQTARRMKNVLPLIAPIALAFIPSVANAGTSSQNPTITFTVTGTNMATFGMTTYFETHLNLTIYGFQNLTPTQVSSGEYDIYSFTNSEFEAMGGTVTPGDGSENGWTQPTDFTLGTQTPQKAIHATDPPGANDLTFTIDTFTTKTDDVFQDQPLVLKNKSGMVIDTVSATPEPSSVAALGIMSLCLGGAALIARKRRAGSSAA